jgi:hypothetical protein
MDGLHGWRAVKVGKKSAMSLQWGFEYWTTILPWNPASDNQPFEYWTK